MLTNDENQGLIATLDRLLSMVHAPYFALSDQDDIWDQNKLQTSIEALEAGCHQLVYSDVRIIDDEGAQIPYLLERRAERRLK